MAGLGKISTPIDFNGSSFSLMVDILQPKLLFVIFDKF